MGHLRIVEHLLAIGAKADLQDDEGRTAFDLAESADHSEVSELLR
jgi:ankyrin repeat protein